ncbi:MAG: carbamoyl phosphate synthase small subunit [Euryarchaeota archaeon]|nr:carbamoyl phosphate synthase small subunit [Euryarchaeota archaeon]
MSEESGHAGFSPGRGQSGVSDPPHFPDAADKLVDTKSLDPFSGPTGVLLLADGTRMQGRLFGSCGIGQGEIVFTTGMCGYQESMTDPSFRGQILTFTWPLLGNYGIHRGMSESSGLHPRGIVCRELMLNPDHRDSIGSVHEFLAAHNVPGICDIDTRSLTRKVREHGTMLAIFGPSEQEEEMSVLLDQMEPPDKNDLVAEVTITKPVVINPGALSASGSPLRKLAVLDCGIKFNILRELCNRFEVMWCPADMELQDIMTLWSPDALFASNGPGDPAHPGAARKAKETLAGAVRQGLPVMGICLGHQLMGLAAGLRTYKLRYGHRGANQPVLDLQSNKVHITSQNHGFAVEDPSRGMLAPHPSGALSDTGENILNSEFTVRYINANDGTVEGLDLINRPCFTIQFHPEACPGPHDASLLFDRFSTTVDDNIKSHQELRSRA